MTFPLPDFPPLFAPGEWWRRYAGMLIAGQLAALEGDATGADGAGIVVRCNEGAGMKARDWMRFGVAGGAVMSLPVVGGASALKNHRPDSWLLAPQADREWRRILATLATIYGKAPYFDEVRALCSALPLTPGAPAFCLNAFEAVERFLGLRNLLPDLGTLIADRDVRLGQVCREMSARVDPSLSILDSLMHLGPDAIFTLIATF